MIRTETPAGPVEWALLDESDIERLAAEYSGIPAEQALILATSLVSAFEARLGTSAEGYLAWLHNKLAGSPHHVVQSEHEGHRFLACYDGPSSGALFFFFELLGLDASTCLVWAQCLRPCRWREYLDLVRWTLGLFGARGIAKLPAEQRQARLYAKDRYPRDEEPPATEPSTRILLAPSALEAQAAAHCAQRQAFLRQAEDKLAGAREVGKRALVELLRLEKALVVPTPKQVEAQPALSAKAMGNTEWTPTGDRFVRRFRFSVNADPQRLAAWVARELADRGPWECVTTAQGHDSIIEASLAGALAFRLRIVPGLAPGIVEVMGDFLCDDMGALHDYVSLYEEMGRQQGSQRWTAIETPRWKVSQPKGQPEPQEKAKPETNTLVTWFARPYARDDWGGAELRAWEADRTPKIALLITSVPNKGVDELWLRELLDAAGIDPVSGWGYLGCPCDYGFCKILDAGYAYSDEAGTWLLSHAEKQALRKMVDTDRHLDYSDILRMAREPVFPAESKHPEPRPVPGGEPTAAEGHDGENQAETPSDGTRGNDGFGRTADAEVGKRASRSGRGRGGIRPSRKNA